ncbi:hypothetical protein [Desulfatiglans anilini]|uniref:hypothetical protein n=1 Tax=Desulfatiglans anilini TaxID=90728 RepID=UPI000414160F|nr:hypothetical protein [Desulfatiglans anilini]
MTILFSQYWDVNPGEYDEYSKFISETFNPGLEKLGIRMLGGFYVAVGAGPRIVAAAAVENDAGLLAAFSSREYRIMATQLQRYVYNYGNRVWIPTGMFRNQTFNIQTGAWKFNQYYDIVPGQEEAHNRFVSEEAIPMMKDMGVPVTHGWRLAIGSGPRILAECTARSLADIAKAIDSAQYRRLSRTLKKQYAVNFSSRILAPTGRVEVPYLIAEMMKGF